jgi:hypothetical protein
VTAAPSDVGLGRLDALGPAGGVSLDCPRGMILGQEPPYRRLLAQTRRGARAERGMMPVQQLKGVGMPFVEIIDFNTSRFSDAEQ